MDRYFGKYRGKVESNIDPQHLGRLKITCPAVLGDGRFAWALPCTPYAGSGVGLFLIPSPGTNIWVEFEGGDADNPIWSGCFWGLGELPEGPGQANTKLLKTECVELAFDDVPGSGGVRIAVGPPAVPVPATLEITAAGIAVSTAAGRFQLSELAMTATAAIPKEPAVKENKLLRHPAAGRTMRLATSTA